MTINSLLERGLIERRDFSEKEISDLFDIVERDLNDSNTGDLSLDWKFGIAYNAALKLATILVRGSSLRVKSGSHHMNTIALLPAILGEDYIDDKNYLDSCRRKRNAVEYDYTGGVTEIEVAELQDFVVELKTKVEEWCVKNSISLLDR